MTKLFITADEKWHLMSDESNLVSQDNPNAKIALFTFDEPQLTIKETSIQNRSTTVHGGIGNPALVTFSAAPSIIFSLDFDIACIHDENLSLRFFESIEECEGYLTILDDRAADDIITSSCSSY